MGLPFIAPTEDDYEVEAEFKAKERVRRSGIPRLPSRRKKPSTFFREAKPWEVVKYGHHSFIMTPKNLSLFIESKTSGADYNFLWLEELWDIAINLGPKFLQAATTVENLQVMRTDLNLMRKVVECLGTEERKDLLELLGTNYTHFDQIKKWVETIKEPNFITRKPERPKGASAKEGKLKKAKVKEGKPKKEKPIQPIADIGFWYPVGRGRGYTLILLTEILEMENSNDAMSMLAEGFRQSPGCIGEILACLCVHHARNRSRGIFDLFGY